MKRTKTFVGAVAGLIISMHILLFASGRSAAAAEEYGGTEVCSAGYLKVCDNNSVKPMWVTINIDNQCKGYSSVEIKMISSLGEKHYVVADGDKWGLSLRLAPGGFVALHYIGEPAAQVQGQWTWTAVLAYGGPFDKFSCSD